MVADKDKEEKAKEPEEAVRFEDDPKNFPASEEKPAPVSAKEVPLEDSRRDATSLLATDRVDSEGNVTPQ